MPYAIQTAHRQHDLAAGFVRCRTSAVAGIAAVGHDRQFVAIADREYPRDLVHFAGQQHQRRRAAIQAAKVGGEGRDVVRGIEPGAVADDRLELRERCRLRRARH